ncbi:MAG: hypothetical protein UV60_C0009G0011 [Parcubacteria group bacterium GW2011_GWA2_43_11]|nr:MAG: hypothetical protein UV60_C0009G0011 [Parcubacteria group bacterium GW2011_GWA2_43_11]
MLREKLSVKIETGCVPLETRIVIFLMMVQM